MGTSLAGGFRCVLDFWLQVNSLSEGKTILKERWRRGCHGGPIGAAMHQEYRGRIRIALEPGWLN